MKRRTLFIVIGVLVLLGIIVTVIPLGASAADTEIETSSTTTVETHLEIGSENAEFVADVLENTSNKSEAILIIAEKLGITAEDAEFLINAVIKVGDEYFGQDQWWIAFRSNVESDMQFWTVVVVAILCVAAAAFGIIVLLAKTNPGMKKAVWEMKKERTANEQVREENSQTLSNLTTVVEETAKKETILLELIAEKDDRIEALELKNKKLEEAMITGSLYTMRMVKLVCDRTTMPLQDKATINYFFTQGVAALEQDLKPEDVARIEEPMAALNDVKSAGDISE